jgi:hypothetical protein
MITILATYFKDKEGGFDFIKGRYRINPKKENFYILLDFNTPDIVGSLVVNAKQLLDKTKKQKV